MPLAQSCTFSAWIARTAADAGRTATSGYAHPDCTKRNCAYPRGAPSQHRRNLVPASRTPIEARLPGGRKCCLIVRPWPARGKNLASHAVDWNARQCLRSAKHSRTGLHTLPGHPSAAPQPSQFGYPRNDVPRTVPRRVSRLFAGVEERNRG